MSMSKHSVKLFAIKILSFFQGPPPKPARRQGGWAEESSGSSSAKYVSTPFPPSPVAYTVGSNCELQSWVMCY